MRSDDEIKELIAEALVIGASTKLVVVNPITFWEVARYLDARVELVNDSFDSIVLESPGNKVRVISDADCPLRALHPVRLEIVPAGTSTARRDRRTIVMEALGAASTCWSDLNNAGVFDSSRAVAIGEQLLAELERDDESKSRATPGGTPP